MKNILVAIIGFAGASSSLKAWRSRTPRTPLATRSTTPRRPVFPCRPWLGFPWRAPCRSPWHSAPRPSSPSSTPAARTTSSRRRRRGAPVYPSANAPASQPWSPMASGSPAPASSATRPCSSTASRSRPTSTSCHWPGTTSSSAPGGSASWGPLFGTSAAVACPSNARGAPSPGPAWPAPLCRPWAQ
uniref:Uncharacterized protein n=1 Tax=Arundo donax TaxID=35708 RepID=A0A0A9DF21_ARUDO